MFNPDRRTGRNCRYARRGVPIALLAAGLAAAVLLGAAAPAAANPGGDPWYRLRVCESGNNYRINTGNGFYGAYQFTAGTWHGYGGSGLPSNAPPAEQDMRAKLLYQARGWAPWPACSRRLGLRSDPSYGHAGTGAGTGTAARATASARPAARPATRHRTVRPVATIPVKHRRHVAVTPKRPARPAAHPATPRLAVWSAPDGGRWGRPAMLLVPSAGARSVLIRIPVAEFRYLPKWAALARPL